MSLSDRPSADYRVKVSVRNARILRRMEELGIPSVAALARRMGVSPPATLNELVTFTTPPLLKNGMLRPIAMQLCETLKSTPQELWPPQHLERPLKRRSVEIDVTASDVAALLESQAPSPLAVLEDLSAKDDWAARLSELLEELPPRHAHVLRSRVGLDGAPQRTLEELAAELGVGRERIRQIEGGALRRMRQKFKRYHDPTVLERLRRSQGSSHLGHCDD